MDRLAPVWWGPCILGLFTPCRILHPCTNDRAKRASSCSGFWRCVDVHRRRRPDDSWTSACRDAPDLARGAGSPRSDSGASACAYLPSQSSADARFASTSHNSLPVEHEAQSELKQRHRIQGLGCNWDSVLADWGASLGRRS